MMLGTTNIKFFVTCWFQFCAEVALFVIIYCSVQIIYKKIKYILQSMSHLPDFPGDILDKPFRFPLKKQVFLHYRNKPA